MWPSDSLTMGWGSMIAEAYMPFTVSSLNMNSGWSDNSVPSIAALDLHGPPRIRNAHRDRPTQREPRTCTQHAPTQTRAPCQGDSPAVLAGPRISPTGAMGRNRGAIGAWPSSTEAHGSTEIWVCSLFFMFHKFKQICKCQKSIPKQDLP